MNKNKLKLVHDKLHQPLISTLIKGNVKEKKTRFYTYRDH